MIVAARWVLECLIALLVLLFAVAVLAYGVARADRLWTSDDVHAALVGASEQVVCIVRMESTFEPYARNPTSGAMGPVQIVPGLSADQHFRAAGWTDRNNPYQAIQFLKDELALGRGGQWVAYWLCPR